jgi:aspartate/methionine/tyrosine aminotransferase
VRERERRVSCCAALVLNCGAWTANDWKLDFDELESKITPKSKILIFNNPTNIPGKVRPPHTTAHTPHTHRTTFHA